MLLGLAPSHIRFTQRRCKNSFSNGGMTLEEAACSIAGGELSPHDLPTIRVVMHDDSHCYSLDNRRLAVFRLLQMTGNIHVIPVETVDKMTVAKQWKRKHDTKTSGKSILVRQILREVGQSRDSTTFPLHKIEAAAIMMKPKHALHGLSLQHKQKRVRSLLERMKTDDESDEEDLFSGRLPAQPPHVQNLATEATYNSEPEWQGAHKFVARGTYSKGQRCGDQCVVKWFKNGPVYSEVGFTEDLKAIDKAKLLLSSFNNQNRLQKPIYINEATVWTKRSADQRGYQRLLVEPFIEGIYRRFNSNTGYQSPGHDIMAALSHFSYHVTSGQAVLCDLQGGCNDTCYVLTDPVILSSSRSYGATDLGQDGIDHFFSQHRCTSFCSVAWLRPVNARSIFEVREGTSIQLGSRMLYGTSSRRECQPMRVQQEDHRDDQRGHQQDDGQWSPLAVFIGALLVLMMALVLSSHDGRTHF